MPMFPQPYVPTFLRIFSKLGPMFPHFLFHIFVSDFIPLSPNVVANNTNLLSDNNGLQMECSFLILANPNPNTRATTPMFCKLVWHSCSVLVRFGGRPEGRRWDSFNI